VHLIADPYIVITVNPEHLFGDIGLAGDIHTVGGNLKMENTGLFAGDVDIQTVEDGLHRLVRYFLAYQFRHPVKRIPHNGFSHRCGVDINDITCYLTAGKLLYKHCSSLQCVDGHLRISASLKPV